MSLEENLALVCRNTDEIVTVEELKKLLETKDRKTAYIGFEPSGLMHIGQGVICANKILDLTRVGFEVTILFADWHAYINDKLNGNIEYIRACGKYMEDCFIAFGIDTTKTKFMYATELMDDSEYWEKVIRVSKKSSLSRLKRALTIMGRREDELELDSSKLLYPLMQVADIFQLDIDVAYSGLDQRRAHMLARDVAERLGWKKPIAIHTPLLTGLQGEGRMDVMDAKMSKSNPDSCIFVHDSEDDIKRKIGKSYCPERVTEGNPVIDICRHIIFPTVNKFIIERREEHGGNLDIESYDQLRVLYSRGQLHPADLKNATSKYLTQILDPIRKYFEKKPENLEKMMKLKVAK